MSREKRYRLADSTVIEPLVDRWSAWSYLIAPVTAGLHLLHYQLKVMESYLADPEMHVKASQDPHFSGAAFMNIPSERTNEVRRLLAQTKQKREASLKFSRSITEFHNLLVAEADGESLRPFYEWMPESLGGYVELVYDYYNRASVRFLEGMLYESPYYDESLQSLSIFNLKRDSARAFFLNTPRLHEPDRIDCAMPFAGPHADELFRLQCEPQPLGHIRELLNLNATEEQRLLPFLSAEAVSKPPAWEGRGVRLRYFGHACVLIEWEGVSILTDPLIPVTPSAGGLERLTFRDLPEKIDYALVTHNHQDHFMIESLLRLRHRIECLVVPKTFGILYGDISLKLMGQKLGFKHVVELDTYESIMLPGGEIIAIPFLGEHADIAHGKTGYVIRAGRQQILFGADSDCLDRRVYDHVRSFFGPIETVFLGLECVGAPLSWGYGALLPKRPSKSQDDSRRQHGCDLRAAMEILETIGARRFYNYAMGMEPWLEYILGLGLSEDSVQWQESDRLLAKTRERGLVSERLCGSREIFLDDTTSSNRAFVSVASVSSPAQDAVLDDDAEAQFQF